MTVDTNTTVPPSRGVRFQRHWFVRFIIFFVTLTVFYAASQIGLSLFAKTLAKPIQPWVMLGGYVIAIPILLFVYRTLVAWLESRPVAELDRGIVVQSLIGAAIGFALFSGVIDVLIETGHGTLAVPPVLIFPTLALAISLISGVAEELIFRGGMFRIVEERWGTLVGLIVSAGFFGAIHGGNPGATVVSSVAIALEAGLMLALCYTATRSLWLPIGLHFGWNFTEGGVFTTQVSGGKVPGLLKTTLTGPDIITGGSFGPEASVIAVAVCLTAALIFLIVTLRRGEWRPFTLRKHQNLR